MRPSRTRGEVALLLPKEKKMKVTLLILALLFGEQIEELEVEKMEEHPIPVSTK